LWLGATWLPEERAYNFALYSKHAERVQLLVFQDEAAVEPVFVYDFDPLRNKSGRIWHCRVPIDAIGDAHCYAYRVGGPEPAGQTTWHTFDPDKLLLDPYARSVAFPPGFDRAAAIAPGPNDAKAPLAVLCSTPSAPDPPAPPPRHESDSLIYELHVRGFTQNPNSGVSESARGRFAGVVEKIPYLLALGVTMVELMPVFQYDPQGRGCWGYQPLNFFSPHRAYAGASDSSGSLNEFRSMVRALHAAGIEVLLDVVYNHTCEGDHTGPVYSFKGIDNSTYYLTSGDAAAPYLDFSGTGNTLNTRNAAVRRLVLDSLRFWAGEMEVDGFRFDLASIFSRGADGSLRWDEPPIISEIGSDPALARLRLIAEPWDSAGGYALGRAFPGVDWLQWNGRFRDDLRRFVRGDPEMVASLMGRLYGSDDLFPDSVQTAYHAWQSVNYVTCHDGFTLYDLVSYNAKRNWANGEENRDGPEENYSWNCGWEGDEGVPAEVAHLRRRQARNYLILLLLANGTPMIRSGDEFLQTQGGNSNPYNQDNETFWLDWSRLEANRDFHRFARLAIAFRKAHPSLARSRFWREEVRWYSVRQPADLGHGSQALAYALHGASQTDDDLYVMINASRESVLFEIQEGAAPEWLRVVDTARESPDDFCEAGTAKPLASSAYQVAPFSVVVLLRRR
jgi:isoamylase